MADLVCEVCGTNPRTDGTAIFTVERHPDGKVKRRRCRNCMTPEEARSIDPTVRRIVNAIEFGSVPPPEAPGNEG